MCGGHGGGVVFKNSLSSTYIFSRERNLRSRWAPFACDTVHYSRSLLVVQRSCRKVTHTAAVAQRRRPAGPIAACLHVAAWADDCGPMSRAHKQVWLIMQSCAVWADGKWATQAHQPVWLIMRSYDHRLMTQVLIRPEGAPAPHGPPPYSPMFSAIRRPRRIIL